MKIPWMLLLLFSVPALARGPESVEETYAQAEKFLKRGYYVKALEEFQSIRNHHRDHPLAVEAELAIADVYYEQGEWDLARMSYSDFQRLHPRHVRLDYAVYRHGSAALQKASRIADRDQTWTQQAVNTWSNFSQRFPESAHGEEVEEQLAESRERLAHKEFRIGRFYYKREAWAAARGRLEGMVQRYPSSADLPRALAMLAVCAERLGEIGLAAELAERLVTDHPEAVRARQHVRRRAAGLLKPAEKRSDE